MTRIERLRDFIAASGLLTSFVDIKGDTQTAPSQMLDFVDSEKLAANQGTRYIAIVDPSTNGAAIPLYSDEREIIIAFFGKGGTGAKLDRRIIADYAEQVNEYLRVNHPDSDNCMYKATPRGVNGPFTNDDGRFVYDLRVSCWFRG